MLSRFHLIPEHYGQTDRLTDRRTDLIYQYRASVVVVVVVVYLYSASRSASNALCILRYAYCAYCALRAIKMVPLSMTLSDL